MVRLALENSDWICASSWESDQPKFVAFSEVTRHHDRYLNEQLQRKFGRVRTMFLCGGDLIKRCGLQDGRDYWICAVGRPGKGALNLLKRLLMYASPLATLKGYKIKNHSNDAVRKFVAGSTGKKPVVLVEKELHDISSTKMREHIRRGKSLHELTFAPVADYLYEVLQLGGKEPNNNDSVAKKNKIPTRRRNARIRQAREEDGEKEKGSE